MCRAFRAHLSNRTVPVDDRTIHSEIARIGGDADLHVVHGKGEENQPAVSMINSKRIMGKEKKTILLSP